ncbi:MAG: nucleoside 2-deoxyribosyltransferase [Nitrososphaerota archaeon]|nr:nucleoside 2-deoxyribosyltransferase [Candidatus Bathyarchaeota archaeon]MDW8023952.1 nucleoside 2-deoxyribosyltransferase [Nitrososphaerota archaeon]
MKVFISGPIQGVETKQSYRDKISRICVRCGFEPVDPWKREKMIHKGEERGWWEKVPSLDFVRRDLEDIEKCDVLIAYLPRLSAGTCIELFYAKMKGKKAICICRLKNPSPWIIIHSDIVIKSIGELENALRAIANAKRNFRLL